MGILRADINMLIPITVLIISYGWENLYTNQGILSFVMISSLPINCVFVQLVIL